MLLLLLLLLFCISSTSVQASAVSGTKADSTVPFRRLLDRDHTSDRDLEDRSAAVTNPTLAAAVKRLEVSAAAAGWLVMSTAL
jgi:hypothetical protein